MGLSLTYWFMFPLAILIATIAMLTGVGGTKFFSPLFILGLHLDPQVAFAVALLTQSFGFMSGLHAYWSRSSIDCKTGMKLLAVTLPAALAAETVSSMLPAARLEQIFAVILIGLSLLVLGRHYQPEDGPRRPLGLTGYAVAGLGGAFLGLISVGLAELLTPFFLMRQRYSYPLTVGTTVFVMFFTTLFSAGTRILGFVMAGNAAVLHQTLQIAMFTIPGVLIGGQIGPRLIEVIDTQKLKTLLRVSFTLVGLFMLIQSFH